MKPEPEKATPMKSGLELANQLQAELDAKGLTGIQVAAGANKLYINSERHNKEAIADIKLYEGLPVFHCFLDKLILTAPTKPVRTSRFSR